jgi:hypothetical protein
MSKFMGGFTVPKYKITATLGMIVVAGQVVRNEGNITYTLGTPLGVTAWCKEQQPFVSLKITDMETKQDVTTDFVRDLQFVKSRYGNGINFVDMRNL